MKARRTFAYNVSLESKQKDKMLLKETDTLIESLREIEAGR